MMSAHTENLIFVQKNTRQAELQSRLQQEGVYLVCLHLPDLKDSFPSTSFNGFVKLPKFLKSEKWEESVIHVELLSEITWAAEWGNSECINILYTSSKALNAGIFL